MVDAKESIRAIRDECIKRDYGCKAEYDGKSGKFISITMIIPREGRQAFEITYYREENLINCMRYLDLPISKKEPQGREPKFTPIGESVKSRRGKRARQKGLFD